MLEDTNLTINICFFYLQLFKKLVTAPNTSDCWFSFTFKTSFAVTLEESSVLSVQVFLTGSRIENSEIMTPDSFCEEASSHQLGKMLDEKVNKQHGKLNMK